MTKPEDSKNSDAVGRPLDLRVVPLGWARKQDLLTYAPCWMTYTVKPAPENGHEPVALYSQDQLDAATERLRDALAWYANEARACAKNSGSARHDAPQALLASVTVLALDAGRRADDALRHNVGGNRLAAGKSG